MLDTYYLNVRRMVERRELRGYALARHALRIAEPDLVQVLRRFGRHEQADQLQELPPPQRRKEYRVAEIASNLSVGRKFVYNLVNSGALASALDADGKIVVTDATLRKWLESCKTDGPKKRRRRASA